MSIKEKLADFKTEFELTLYEQVTRLLDVEPNNHAERFAAAIRYSLFGGGKRLRPFLFCEAAKLFNLAKPPLIASCAVEIIHCYSLVHDDLPSFDNDHTRRGRPSVHIAFDEATAILVGNALQALAFSVLADPECEGEPSQKTELVSKLADSAGGNALLLGQYLDLAAENRFGDNATGFDRDQICRLQELKTSRLFSFALTGGAILAGASNPAKNDLNELGRLLGLVFQNVDDLADNPSISYLSEDKTPSDLAAEKSSLLHVHGYDSAKEITVICAVEAKRILENYDNSDTLMELIDHITAAK